MRLLELVVHTVLFAALAYSLLVRWGFETQHFIMIAEGKVPKRIHPFDPSKRHEKPLLSPTESLNNVKSSESKSSQSVGSILEATNTTNSSQDLAQDINFEQSTISEKVLNLSTKTTSPDN